MRSTRSRGPLLCLLAGALLAGPALVAALPIAVTAAAAPTTATTAIAARIQPVPRTEVHYDSATRLVTLRIALPDAANSRSGGLHPEDFVVYENGVRQHSVRVRAEHGAISVGLLLEYGGRYPSLDDTAGSAVSMAAEQFVSDIEAHDRVAVWTYGDRLRQLTGFTQDRDTLQGMLYTDLQAPPFSELNFYDAVLNALARIRAQPAERALIVVSSGRDTFSRATFQQALRAARTGGVPIYFINLEPLLERFIVAAGTPSPYATLDLSSDEMRMQQLATASGGRVYSPDDMLDLSGLYDDLMETLRVRYRVTYRSDSDAGRDIARIVRVELLDPPGAARPIDDAGQPPHAQLIAEASYRPGRAARASLTALATGARHGTRLR